MERFSYSNFSDEAREAVLTAADLALSVDSKTVRGEHMKEALKGASRGPRPMSELGRIPFDLALAHALTDVHDAAVAAGKKVELKDLRKALG